MFNLDIEKKKWIIKNIGKFFIIINILIFLIVVFIVIAKLL